MTEVVRTGIVRASWIVVAALGCSGPQQSGTAEPARPGGHLPDGSILALTIRGERIAAVSPTAEVPIWLWPPIVDSHVHLALWPVADTLAARGVEVAVDLAAPEASLGAASPIHLIAAGPMLTHPDGYPLDGWGAAGYGVGCADAACVTTTIDRLAARGAGIIKVALDDDGLDPALLPAAVAAAHAHDLGVAVHAVSDASVATAAAAGVDILAHTPVERLSPATVQAWRGRAVISTLAAFGGSETAIDNLRRLREVGVTVLYGTDLGNLRDDGPSARELELLRAAGLDDAAIVDAMTTTPLAFWNVPLAPIAVGGEATFLELDGDPRRDAGRLLSPRMVWLRGHPRPR